ncbi:MAG: hypothetical protein Q4D14_05215 [Bacteroidales bacterium]|nr:hypothetical protein [Bacteroidales bacterium]
MTKEDALKICKFYKGEDSSSNYFTYAEKMLWVCERNFVESAIGLTDDTEMVKHFEECLKDIGKDIKDVPIYPHKRIQAEIFFGFGKMCYDGKDMYDRLLKVINEFYPSTQQ